MPETPTSRDLAWEGILHAMAYDRLVTVEEILERNDLPEAKRATVQDTLRSMRELGLVEMRHHGVYQLTDDAVELFQDVLGARLAIWNAGRSGIDREDT